MAHPFRHFRTITKHRHKVIANCARVGILWQGLRHDLSKYSPTEFCPVHIIIRMVRDLQTNGNAWNMAVPMHGCTTKGATAIILNTGSITTRYSADKCPSKCR